MKTELETTAMIYGGTRRTRVVTEEDESHVYDKEAYIVAEDTNVVVSRDGWVKRVQKLKDPTATRTREGDEVAWVLPGSTRECIAFFTNYGSAYVILIDEIPATSGYGDPIQKLFRFADGERVVGALSLDPRVTPSDVKVAEDEIPPPYLFAATVRGNVLQFPLHPHREPSTRTGRRFCRLDEGDEVLAIQLTRHDRETVILASHRGRALLFSLGDVKVLAGSGKGTHGMKLEKGDRLVAARVVDGPREGLAVETSRGATHVIKPAHHEIGTRARKGHVILKRGRFLREVRPAPALVTLEAEEGTEA